MHRTTAACPDAAGGLRRLLAASRRCSLTQVAVDAVGGPDAALWGRLQRVLDVSVMPVHMAWTATQPILASLSSSLRLAAPLAATAAAAKQASRSRARAIQICSITTPGRLEGCLPWGEGGGRYRVRAV